jgi:GT2 family glycosyltransferase
MSRTPLPRIAAVVLNYNSAEDTVECIDRLLSQRGTDLSIIVVDNPSSTAHRKHLEDLVLSRWPGTPRGSWTELQRQLSQKTDRSALILLWAAENRGYSSGNNLGIAAADALGCESVLIINPDARLEGEECLAGLHRALMADCRNFAAGPRIRGLSGHDENPLREPTFWEEFLWPVTILRRRFCRHPAVVPVRPGAEPYEVPKISGTCLLLRMDYLRSDGYLDDTVFMYCEEPILVARIRRAGGRLVFVPNASVLHAHRKSAKGRLSPRLLAFVKSRSYYLRTYSGYGRLAQNALIASHYLFAWTVGLQDLLPSRKST